MRVAPMGTRRLLPALVAGLLVGLAGLVAPAAAAAPAVNPKPPPAATSKPAPTLLPRMVDLGAGKCVPCKKMAPIIEEMRGHYAGIVDIVFIDVWKDPPAGKPYRIRVIPTQVFFDREGREVYRHEGFMDRAAIETVFQEKLQVTPLPAKPGTSGSKGGTGPGSDGDGLD